jgi:ribonuclease BN (tRNA processing enzyme)
MDLIVLGGSAAAPNPGDASAGYLVVSGETSILLDCGSGVASKLRQHRDPRTLSAVVISHLHADHTLDLVALRYTLQYTPPGPGTAIPLYLPPHGQEFLGRLGDVFASGNERPDDFWDRTLTLLDYAPHLASGAPLRIGGLALTFAPMQHYIPVWAIRIEEVATGRSLTFSADTGPQAPLADFARGSDLLLCEATLLEQTPGSDPAGVSLGQPDRPGRPRAGHPAAAAELAAPADRLLRPGRLGGGVGAGRTRGGEGCLCHVSPSHVRAKSIVGNPCTTRPRRSRR